MQVYVETTTILIVTNTNQVYKSSDSLLSNFQLSYDNNDLFTQNNQYNYIFVN